MLATVLGILSVALLARGDGRGWPLGTLMVLCLGWVYWNDAIYGSTALQVVFFILQLAGWRRWATGTEPDLRRSSRTLGARGRLWILLAWSVATAVLAPLLRSQGSELVEADAFVTAGSLVGQALIVASFAEAWLIYLAVDVIYVGLSYQAGRPALARMFLVYCGLAAYGWWEWTRDRQDGKRNDAQCTPPEHIKLSDLESS